MKTLENDNENINLRSKKSPSDLNKKLNVFQKAVKFAQSRLLSFSDKINIPKSPVISLILFFVGFVLLFSAFVIFPSYFFSNPRLILMYFLFGNLVLNVSFCLYYGSKDYIQILVDDENICFFFAHLIYVVFSVVFLNNYYLAQLLMAILLFYSSFNYLVILFPEKEKFCEIYDGIWRKAFRVGERAMKKLKIVCRINK